MGRFSIYPFVHPPPPSRALEPARQVSEPARQASEPASQASEPASQASEPASQASEPASQASEALRPASLALRPAWLGLRPAWLALGRSRRGMDGQTDGWMENLPILQDFAPYRSCYPATAQLQPKNCIKWGRGTADHIKHLGD